MDMESLERLAIDRVLGALPPEVEALLAEYLGHDPAAAAMADDFAATARLAKDALGSGPSPSLPPFPLDRMRLARRSRERRARLGSLATVAVSLALGIGLGVLASRHPATGEMSQPSVAVPRTVNVAARPAEPAADRYATQFWSRERLVERALAATPARSPRLVWTSPIRPPRTEVPHGTLDPGT